MKESEEEPFEEEPSEEEPFEEEPVEEDPSEEEPVEEAQSEEEPFEEEPSEQKQAEQELSKEEAVEEEPNEEEPTEEKPSEEEPFEEEPSEEPFEEEPSEEEPIEEEPSEEEPFEEEPSEEPFEEERNEENPIEEKPSEEKPFKEPSKEELFEEPREEEPFEEEPNEENLCESEPNEEVLLTKASNKACQISQHDHPYEALSLKGDNLTRCEEEPCREESCLEGRNDEDSKKKPEEAPSIVDLSEKYEDHRSYSCGNNKDCVRPGAWMTEISTDIMADVKKDYGSHGGANILKKSENLFSTLLVSEKVNLKRKQSRSDVAGDSRARKAVKRRHTTCSNDKPDFNMSGAVKIPDFIFDPEFQKLHVQATEISRRLSARELIDDRPEDQRSPSPPPIYDIQDTVKVNSTDSRLCGKLMAQRQTIISKLIDKFPDFIPPAYYKKPKLTKKI